LKTGGLNVCFGGNIGMAPLSLIGEDDKDKIFVLELSSFQLVGLKRSPRVAVIQAIVREHLDYHGGFSEYLLAKENIVRYQGENDRVIFNRDSSLAVGAAGKSKGEKLPFGGSEADGSRCFLDQENIIFISKKGREEIIPVREIPLLGSFNIQNVMPAIVVGRELGISAEVIAEAIKGFRSLPHRLEFVRGSSKTLSNCLCYVHTF
jgi:UDP-N-acetylmuramoylalanine--D-glutamate ligase